MHSLRARSLGLVVLSLCAPGCEKKPENEPPRPPVTQARSADAGTRAERIEVRVPLPPDWEARLGQDGELRVGPTGKAPVLRIAPQREEPAKGPDLDALVTLLPDESKAKHQRVRDTADTRILTYSIGSSPGRSGLLGARRPGTDWFLCAATRPLEPTQLEIAVEACAGLRLASR